MSRDKKANAGIGDIAPTASRTITLGGGTVVTAAQGRMLVPSDIDLKNYFKYISTQRKTTPRRNNVTR